MNWWIRSAFVAGGLVALLNFYLSFVAALLHRLRHGVQPARVPSGVPLIGSILLGIVAIALPSGTPTQFVALALLAVDTGGPHWFAVSQVRQAIRHIRARSVR